MPFIYTQLIIGSRTFEKCLVSVVGFLLSSYSLYLIIQNHKIIILSNFIFEYIINVILILFTITALALSAFSILEIIEDRGSGYNSFNKRDSVIRIARNDIFGKKIFLTYSIKDVDSIKLDNDENVKQPRIYLIMKDKRKIPLCELDPLMSLEQIEEKAISMASLLELPCSM